MSQNNTINIQARSGVIIATGGHTSNVEFSPMDATRADPRFIFQIVERCIDAGATTINIPDSVGYAIPEELGGLFRALFEHVPNIHKCRVSFHGQNDLGLCTANTLTAIQNGARQVELTINGIGERAGNTSLEEVVMAIKTRKDFLPFYTDINTQEIWKASKMVCCFSGEMPVPVSATSNAKTSAARSRAS